MSVYFNGKKYAGSSLDAYDSAVIGGYQYSKDIFYSSFNTLSKFNSLQNKPGNMFDSIYNNNNFYVPTYLDSVDVLFGPTGMIEQGQVFPGMTFDIDFDGGIKRILVLGVNMVPSLNQNHIVCCPLTDFGSSRYSNSDIDRNGAYKGSSLYSLDSSCLDKIADPVKSKIIPISMKLSSGLNREAPNRLGGNNLGATNQTTSYDAYFSCLTEREVFGSIIFGSSGYDSQGSLNQMPTFRMNPSLLQGQSFWLQDIASVNNSCACVDGKSFASSYGLTRSYKPKFVLVP